MWYDLFKKLKINLPSLEEQTAIAEVLETTDQEGNKLNNTPQNLQNPTQQNQIPDPPQSGKFNSSSPQSPTESRMNSGIGAPSDSERPQAAAASGEVQELKIK